MFRLYMLSNLIIHCMMEECWREMYSHYHTVYGDAIPYTLVLQSMSRISVPSIVTHLPMATTPSTPIYLQHIVKLIIIAAVSFIILGFVI